MSLLVLCSQAQVGDTIWYEPKFNYRVHDYDITRGCNIITGDSTFTEIIYYDSTRIWIKEEYKFNPLIGNESKVRHGYLFSFAPDGRIEFISEWRNDDMISAVHYFENGNISSILQRFEGSELYNSRWISYFENGNTESIELQLDGLPIWQEWYCENGQLISAFKIQEHYDQRNWLPDTNYVEYHCNGKLHRHYQYSYYNLHLAFGKCEEWYETGVISRRYEYDAFWDSNYKQYSRSKIGIWKYYDENGRLWKIQKFKRNQLQKANIRFKCAKCEEFFKEPNESG